MKIYYEEIKTQDDCFYILYIMIYSITRSQIYPSAYNEELFNQKWNFAVILQDGNN